MGRSPVKQTNKQNKKMNQETRFRLGKKCNLLQLNDRDCLPSMYFKQVFSLEACSPLHQDCCSMQK